MKKKTILSAVLVVAVFTALLLFSSGKSKESITSNEPELVAKNESKDIEQKPEVEAITSEDNKAKTAESKSEEGSDKSSHKPEVKLASSLLSDFKVKSEKLITNSIEKVSGRDRTVRLKLLETDFKYPKIAVKEIYSEDPKTGKVELRSEEAYVADHMLVTIKEGKSEKELTEYLSKLGYRVKRKLRGGDSYIVQKISEEIPDMDKALVALSGDKSIIAISGADKIIKASKIPNDIQYANQFNMQSLGNGYWQSDEDADVDAPEAWEYTTGSKNVVVAVADTGVDVNHEDLKSNIWFNPKESSGDANKDGCAGVCNLDDDKDGLIDEDQFECGKNGLNKSKLSCTYQGELANDDDENGYPDDINGWDFYDDDNLPSDIGGHGTHVAGIIGATGNNNIGVAGVNWNVSIQALRVLGPQGGTISDIYEGLVYSANNGASIVNASFGGPGESAVLYSAAEKVNQKKVALIAAAGNGDKTGMGVNNDLLPHIPSNYSETLPHVISVAALDNRDNLTYFSNYGARTVTLAAPGYYVLSTTPNNMYERYSGTSMAAPMVAGAFALLKASNQTLTNEAIKNALVTTTDLLPKLSGKMRYPGRLNLGRALTQLRGKTVLAEFSSIQDTGGYQDQLAQNSETLELTVKLNILTRNLSLNGYRAVLVTSSPYASIIQNSATVQHTAGAATATLSAKFKVKLADVFPSNSLPVEFTLNLLGATRSSSYYLPIGIVATKLYTVSGKVLFDGRSAPGSFITSDGRSIYSPIFPVKDDGSYSIPLVPGRYYLRAYLQSGHTYDETVEVVGNLKKDFIFRVPFEGTVTDAFTGLPVPSARVRFGGPENSSSFKFQTYTDENGRYKTILAENAVRSEASLVSASKAGVYFPSKAVSVSTTNDRQTLNLSIKKGGKFKRIDLLQYLPAPYNSLPNLSGIITGVKGEEVVGNFYDFTKPEVIYNFHWNDGKMSVPQIIGQNVDTLFIIQHVASGGNYAGVRITTNPDGTRTFNPFTSNSAGSRILRKVDLIESSLMGVRTGTAAYGYDTIFSLNGITKYMPFYWGSSKMNLPLPSGFTGGMALSGNEDLMVGMSSSDSGSRAVLWKNQNVVELLPKASSTALNERATAISPTGNIAGDFGDLYRTPVLWKNGQAVVIGNTPDQPRGASPTGVNSKNEVVGMNEDGSGVFLWTEENGAMDLNSFIYNFVNFESIKEVIGISDSGAISVNLVGEQPYNKTAYYSGVPLPLLFVPYRPSEVDDLGFVIKAGQSVSNVQLKARYAGPDAKFEIKVQARNGNAVIDSSGKFSYTPNAGWIGADTITYISSENGLEKASGQITVTTIAANYSVPPINILTSTTIDLSKSFGFTGTPTNISIKVVVPPKYGQIVITPDGKVTYVPNRGSLSPDNFEVSIFFSDGYELRLPIQVVATMPEVAPTFEIKEIVPASGHSEVIPYKINKYGDVVGSVRGAYFEVYPFTYFGDTSQFKPMLDFVSSTEAVVVSFNDDLTLAGKLGYWGYVMKSGALSLFQFNGAAVTPKDINRTNQIIGEYSYYDENYVNTKAVFLKDGSTAPVKVPVTGLNPTAKALNNHGHFVGEIEVEPYVNQAYLFGYGITTRLGALTLADSSIANDINDSIVVVGSSIDRYSLTGKAFRWENGKMTEVTKDLFARESSANSIANNGNIVGSMKLEDNKKRAFINVNGKTSDLNTITKLPAGWYIENAVSIADGNYIAATGTINGRAAAFILKPEKATTTDPYIDQGMY